MDRSREATHKKCERETWRVAGRLPLHELPGVFCLGRDSGGGFFLLPALGLGCIG
jgi:hypothetical protein